MISLDPERISTIISLSPPNNVKPLRSFIGMTQFCSRFVHNLNTILAPLYELLKGGNSFSWSVECQTSFDKINSILSSPPILYTPCKGDKFILETDAIDIGIGVCVCVCGGGGGVGGVFKGENGQCEYIVGYCSKTSLTLN